MATYKVIQDIEAEDKFLGPLTLKQFVFGSGGILFAWLSILSLQKGFPWAMLIFIPPMLLGFFLAVPWSKDQPTEVWVLAKLRFYFKPRRRIWDQAGMEELVTITAPKKEERPLVDNLSKTEVKSRLQVLADTIDSRGWAIKDAQMQGLVQPNDDRLVGADALPVSAPIIDLATIPDVYDGSVASSTNLDRMITESAEHHKAHNLEVMDEVRSGKPIKPTKQPYFTPPPSSLPATPVAEISPQDEQSILNDLRSKRDRENIATSHLHKINPLGQNDDPMSAFMDTYSDPKIQNDTAQQSAQNQSQTSVPEAPSPAILNLAGNDDLDIATIARQAKKEAEDDDNEVVVSLH